MRPTPRTRTVTLFVALFAATLGGCQAGPSATGSEPAVGTAAALPSPATASSSPTPSATESASAAPSATAPATVGACRDLPDAPSGRILFELADGDVMRSAIVSATGGGFRLLTDGDTDGAPSWLRGDRILFHSDRAGNIHVFEVPVAGGDVRQLSRGDGFEGMPAASPDGSLIVVDANTSNEPSGLWLLGPNGARIGRLTTNPAPDGFDTSPAFSPDGQSVAFARVLDATPGSARSAIFTVDVDGGDPHQLTAWETNAHHPTWSTDGSRIAFSTNADNNDEANPADIWIIGADGSDLTQLTHESGGRQAYEPGWSPDSDWIAFVGDGLEAITADGSGRCRIWAAETPMGFVKYPEWIGGS